MSYPSVFLQLSQLWVHLVPQRKKQLALLVALMVACSIAEIVSIGAVVPFLGVLTSPETIFVHELAQPFIQHLRIGTPSELLLPATLIFIVAAVLAGLMRITLLWIQMRLAMTIGADFSVKVYEYTLYQPYSSHISRNSSEVLAGTRKAESLVNIIIQPVLTVISSIVVLFAVVATLFAIHPVVALATFISFGFIYAAIVGITRHRIARNSRIIAVQQVKLTKITQEGLGGIRDVLLDGTQSLYSKMYRDAFMPLQLANVSNHLVGTSPRFGVEALGMVVIATLAYILTAGIGWGEPTTQAIPVLGALALGAQRLLPLLQQIYNSFLTIKGNQVSTQDALDLLNQPMPAYVYDQDPVTIQFHSDIILKNVGFRYTTQDRWVMRHLNLRIPKGSRVGFVGVTGSGKSTLLDIIMGLLAPTEGSVLIDKMPLSAKLVRAWQVHISHVPQAVYLSDASIAENIAFGIPLDAIDMLRVRHAAEQAQISKTIESWSKGYETLVGERGVRLSGGQRQRIGIARALYKRANVLIFDEATSALDGETESAVIEAVERLSPDTTVLIIAHRLSTLRNCDFLVELLDGNVSILEAWEHDTLNSA
jgi:ATP-binding cassette subfamily B protein